MVASISCAFGLGGWWLWTRGSGAWWICSAFLVGVPLALIQMIPGSTYVETGPDGLATCSLFRRHVTPWQEIDRFNVVVVASRRVVGVVYKPGAGSKAMRRMARSLSGAEGALPSCVLAPDDLADKLNAVLAAQQADAAGEPQAAGG
jgi:hypothetical protein